MSVRPWLLLLCLKILVSRLRLWLYKDDSLISASSVGVFTLN